LMEQTAWAMTPPAAYGVFHLSFTFIGIAACCGLAWKCKNLGEKGNRRLLLGMGIFLILTEVYKQLFYYYYIGNQAYQWWIFPFQLCSIPMYLCVIAPWVKSRKIQQALYDFMLVYNLLGVLMAFIEPSGIIHEYLTLTLHAFIWHMTLIFIGFYLGISGRAGRENHNYINATKIFLILCVMAFCINLIFRRISDGSINMFFVGPSNSPLVIFSSISEHFGWWLSTLLYIPVVSLGAFLIFKSYQWMGRKRI